MSFLWDIPSSGLIIYLLFLSVSQGGGSLELVPFFGSSLINHFIYLFITLLLVVDVVHIHRTGALYLKKLAPDADRKRRMTDSRDFFRRGTKRHRRDVRGPLKSSDPNRFVSPLVKRWE